MSSNALGRSAITILTPRATLFIPSAARRSFCSESLTLFERPKRNIRFYPPWRRDLRAPKLRENLFSGRYLVFANGSSDFLSCASLDRIKTGPSHLTERSLPWPKFLPLFASCEQLRGGSRQHGGLQIIATRRRYKSSSGTIRDGEGSQKDVAGNQKNPPSFITPKSIVRANLGNKHIMDSLPGITHIHRPSKEELLAAATGFWARLKVRFKWFSIRSARPFNIDEIGAFFSWILVGHVLWIILGTTTFFSLAIFAVNTVFAQGEFVLLLKILLYLLRFRDISSLGRELSYEIFRNPSRF